MTTLQLFWIASATGAALFFLAGALVARRGAAARLGRAELGWVPPDRPESQREVVELERRLEELGRELAARRAREGALETELAAARERTARLDAQIGGRQDRMAELAREIAARRAAIAELERDLAAQGERASALETELAAARDKAADDEALLRDRGSQLEVLRGRLRDLEAIRADYVRLRTQRDESEYLRSEIARLEGRLAARLAAPAPAPVPAPRAAQAPRPGASLSLSEALSRAVNRLIDGTVSTAVVADRVGFPVTATDERGASLAAYSTLLVDAADRAHTFVDSGPVHRIAVVDHRELRVSIWPFAVDGESLSLITLSRKAPDVRRVDQVVGELAALLSRARTPAAG